MYTKNGKMTGEIKIDANPVAGRRGTRWPLGHFHGMSLFVLEVHDMHEQSAGGQALK